MTDLEKIISSIEYYCKYPDMAQMHYYGSKIVQMPEQLMRDALALLKAQEPVEPIQDEDGDWICGACKDGMVGCGVFDEAGIEDIRNEHCPKCGRAVKWE